MTEHLNEIRTIRKITSPQYVKALASAYITSTILHGSSVWGVAPEYLIKQIQTAQLHAAHTVIGHPTVMSHSSRILEAVGWSPVWSLCYQPTTM